MTTLFITKRERVSSWRFSIDGSTGEVTHDMGANNFERSSKRDFLEEYFGKSNSEIHGTFFQMNIFEFSQVREIVRNLPETCPPDATDRERADFCTLKNIESEITKLSIGNQHLDFFRLGSTVRQILSQSEKTVLSFGVEDIKVVRAILSNQINAGHGASGVPFEDEVSEGCILKLKKLDKIINELDNTTSKTPVNIKDLRSEFQPIIENGIESTSIENLRKLVLSELRPDNSTSISELLAEMKTRFMNGDEGQKPELGELINLTNLYLMQLSQMNPEPDTINTPGRVRWV